MPISPNDFFEQQIECFYKDEKYSVRDNGAILRHPCQGKRRRKDDNIWTFGKSDLNMYLKIGTEYIHRIVATAFVGEPPTPQHVVDHIDTNRKNNRPENLRWLTKLENILNNPITRKRIIFRCGSIEAFLKDPSVLKKYIEDDPRFDWMRTVTPEEAQAAWKHLIDLTEEENKMNSKSKGSMGEWIYSYNGNNILPKESPEIWPSITPNAVQDWKTPSEFPCCPQGSFHNPISTYFDNLKKGAVFSRNIYSILTINDYAISGDENTLWIKSKASEDDAIKQWYLAQVTFEDNLFVHTNLGGFFEQIGVEKQFTLVQGLEWAGPDSIDDNS